MPSWKAGAEAILVEVDRRRRDANIARLECETGMCGHTDQQHKEAEQRTYWDSLSPIERDHVIAIAKAMTTDRIPLPYGGTAIISKSHGYGIRTDVVAGMEDA